MENRAKYRRILLVAAGFMISVSSHVFAAVDVKVIANSSVRADTISADEIKRVFLEERRSLDDGTHVAPVLEKDGPVHEAFLRAYLGRTDDDLLTYYRALVFTGRGSMPKELDSDAEVVAYVIKTRGAIGYVSAETTTEGVKTLAIARAGNSDQRRLIIRVEPEYPETLKRLNIGGLVRLRVTISAKGNVEDAELLGGNPILGESAISAVKQWVYASSHSPTIAEVSISFDSHR
jgi:TonB family protein